MNRIPIVGSVLLTAFLAQPALAQSADAKQLQDLKTTIDAHTEEVREYRREVREQKESQHSWWTRYVAPLLPPLATVLAAAGGAYVTIRVLGANFRQQDKARFEEWQRQDDLRTAEWGRQELQRVKDQSHSDGARIEAHLIEALKYFEAGAAKRSIGIAFIETYWDQFPGLRRVWATVLATQSVQLLEDLAKNHRLADGDWNDLRRAAHLLIKAETEWIDRASVAGAINAIVSPETLWPQWLSGSPHYVPATLQKFRDMTALKVVPEAQHEHTADRAGDT